MYYKQHNIEMTAQCSGGNINVFFQNKQELNQNKLIENTKEKMTRKYFWHKLI